MLHESAHSRRSLQYLLIASLASLALLLSPIDSQAQWIKKGASPEETSSLVAECRMEAAKSTASMDPVTYGGTMREANILGFGKAIIAGITQSNIFYLCLKAKGFTDGDSTALNTPYSQSKYNLPAGFQAPSVKIEFPQYAEEGGLVPVNLYYDHTDTNDPIESVSVIVESNPVEHRHAFTIQYNTEPPKVGLRFRLRFAKAEKPLAAVVITTRAGKTVTRSFSPERFGKYVDFSNPDSMTPMHVSMEKMFPNRDLGQQRVALRDGFLQTAIYHPMFPAMGGRPALSIERFSVVISGQTNELLTATFGSSLSNNPLFTVYTGDISGTVTWTGANQSPYKANF